MRIPPNTEILVPGLGMYTYETLCRELQLKVGDLKYFSTMENFEALGEQNFNVFVAQWKAIVKAIHEYKQSIEE